jgi:hypothetical protein
MNYLPSYLQFSREAWIGVGIGFLAAMAVMWLLVWFGRRRHVTIGNSPTVEMIAYQLGRIADSLDRFAIQSAAPLREFQQSRQTTKEAQREIEPSHERQQAQTAHERPPEERPVATHRISMSMFGR